MTKERLFSSCRTELACDLCGGHEGWIVGLRDRHGRPLRTVLCQNCGLGWTDPRPHQEAIQTFYQKEYRQQYKGSWRPKLKHTYRAGEAALSRIEQLAPFLTKGASILDLGCGAGELLYLLREEGYRVEGIEPHEGYASYAREELELPVQIQFLKGELPGERQYDLITLFHVLEHLEEPSRFIESAAKRLKTGGLLVIEVPNLKSPFQKPNSAWHRAHLYHFSAATLELIGAIHGLERIANWSSADQGNVTAVLRKGEGPPPFISVQARENAQRTYRLLQKRGLWNYLLHPTTHRRLIKKIALRLREWRAVQKFDNGREALDTLLYERSL